MLKSLSISNFALINELSIRFDKGMTVMTGETGAGKSIIIGALSLIMGQRADTKQVKEGEQKSVVEATFDIANYKLQSFFEDNELDYDAECIIRREITNKGKSRAFVNDTPVALSDLRALSEKLLDIHSQHENLLLVSDDYQLNVVDEVAKNQTTLHQYQSAYATCNEAKAALRKLKKELEQQQSDMDWLQFQFQQLDDAKLAEGEQQELEEELDMLSHAEEIKMELSRADNLLLQDEFNVHQALHATIQSLQKISSYLSDADVWQERLESSLIEIKDIADEISSFQERVEFDPVRLEYVDNRLNTLLTLQKKFKVQTVEELIALREDFRQKVSRVESMDDELLEAEKRVKETTEKMNITAKQLTQSRQKAVPVIEKEIAHTLQVLGMPNVKFEISVKQSDIYTDRGNDEIVFLFSANKNRVVQPISEVASGGEISRLMLAIKSLLVSKSDLPSIVFDEVDTGVSGEIADRMGDIMREMSQHTQVIVITHLPQIASRGNVHFNVYKDSTGEETATHIRQLSESERIREIAQMLSGKMVTEAALMNAKELLKNV